MLDALLRRHTDSLLAPAAARLSAWRIAPNTLTLSAFVLGIVAVLDIGHRAYLVGLGFLVAARLFDILDGPLARRGVPSAFGAYLDQLLDLILAGGLAFAFALAEPDRALAAMFLMLGLTARAGAQATAQLGKTELFVAFALACVFPFWFSIIAYVTGIACFIAAGRCVAVAAIRNP